MALARPICTHPRGGRKTRRKVPKHEAAGFLLGETESNVSQKGKTKSWLFNSHKFCPPKFWNLVIRTRKPVQHSQTHDGKSGQWSCRANNVNKSNKKYQIKVITLCKNNFYIKFIAHRSPSSGELLAPRHPILDLRQTKATHQFAKKQTNFL